MKMHTHTFIPQKLHIIYGIWLFCVYVCCKANVYTVWYVKCVCVQSFFFVFFLYVIDFDYIFTHMFNTATEQIWPSSVRLSSYLTSAILMEIINLFETYASRCNNHKIIIRSVFEKLGETHKCLSFRCNWAFVEILINSLKLKARWICMRASSANCLATGFFGKSAVHGWQKKNCNTVELKSIQNNTWLQIYVGTVTKQHMLLCLIRERERKKWASCK